MAFSFSFIIVKDVKAWIYILQNSQFIKQGQNSSLIQAFYLFFNTADNLYFIHIFI